MEDRSETKEIVDIDEVLEIKPDQGKEDSGTVSTEQEIETGVIEEGEVVVEIVISNQDKEDSETLSPEQKVDTEVTEEDKVESVTSETNSNQVVEVKDTSSDTLVKDNIELAASTQGGTSIESRPSSAAGEADTATRELQEWLRAQQIVTRLDQRGVQTEDKWKYLDLANSYPGLTNAVRGPIDSGTKHSSIISKGVVMTTNLVRKPELFSGEEPELWHEWVERFEVIANANGWDDGRKMQILPSYLTQHAFQLYGEIPKTDIKDYDTLKTMLANRLKTGDKQMLWSLQLRGAKRKAGESQAAFLFRLRKLVGRAHPNQSAAHTNQVMKEQFIMGQPADLQFYLLKMPDRTTLVEIIETAKNYDAAQEIVQGTKTVNMMEIGQNRGEVSNVTNGHNTSTRENGVRGSYVQPVINVGGQDVAGSQQGTNSLVCYNCGQTGHMARVCPRGKNHDLTRITCYNCKQTGHMARNCPNKQAGVSTQAQGQVVCHRCNNKGHQARVCQTDISMQNVGRKGT